MALTLEICSGALRSDSNRLLRSELSSGSAHVGVFLGMGGSTTPGADITSQDLGRSP